MINKFKQWANSKAFLLFLICGSLISFLKYRANEFGLLGALAFFIFFVLFWTSLFTVILNWIKKRITDN